MTYSEHLKANWKVAFKGVLLVVFHFTHGILPIELTSHEYWNINLKK